MSILQPYPAAPIVSIGGIYIDSILSASISSTNSFSADTFAITIAIENSPANNLTFWTTLDTGYVEVYGATTSVCLITGMIDKVTIDIINCVAKVHGRDLSSLLIDASPQQDFTNQTPTEIVTTIADRHELSAVVTAFGRIGGRFYGSNFTRLSISKFTRMRSEWDVVVQLARECQYDVYVSGRNLHFVAPPDCATANAYLTPDLLSTLRVERTLWIPDMPAVQMSSWNSQDRAAYSQTQFSQPDGSSYVFAGSNMTPSQVTSEATRYSAEIGRLRESVVAEMPWNETILVRDVVYLYGTGSALDGIYRVDSLERRFSRPAGSKQNLLLSKVGG